MIFWLCMIGLSSLAELLYLYYRADKKLKDNAYWQAVAKEQARREKLAAELFEKAARYRNNN